MKYKLTISSICVEREREREREYYRKGENARFFPQHSKGGYKYLVAPGGVL